ncbi:hypothetical protein CL3_25520 [butyrate-producing bacterium SM4/1]|nr:hypothetical protein CL3_25520 [butyrate-producing bacterium SM4/1]
MSAETLSFPSWYVSPFSTRIPDSLSAEEDSLELSLESSVSCSESEDSRAAEVDAVPVPGALLAQPVKSSMAADRYGRIKYFFS